MADPATAKLREPELPSHSVEAVVFDALGTLVELRPPAPRLRGELATRGFAITQERADAAFRAEIGFYIEHHLEGADAPSLEALRDRCAEVIRAELGEPRLDHAAARAAMLAAITFAPYVDAAPALTALRERGLKLAVASNWDCSLVSVLDDAGLGRLVDHVVSSAEVGAAKPDPAVFKRALELLGVAPTDAVHVGDSAANDVAGARAASLRPILIDRSGAPRAGVVTIARLDELAALI